MTKDLSNQDSSQTSGARDRLDMLPEALIVPPMSNFKRNKHKLNHRQHTHSDQNSVITAKFNKHASKHDVGSRPSDAPSQKSEFSFAGDGKDLFRGNSKGSIVSFQ